MVQKIGWIMSYITIIRLLPRLVLRLLKVTLVCMNLQILEVQLPTNFLGFGLKDHIPYLDLILLRQLRLKVYLFTLKTI